MTQQMNFIEQAEEAEQEKRWIERKLKKYVEWQTLPEKTFIPCASEERENINSILEESFCELYNSAHHECTNMAEDVYIWLNHNYENYWVLNKRGECGGKTVKECPYCGENLENGKGDVVLYKTPWKNWKNIILWQQRLLNS